jgi:protein MpaA
LSMNVSAYLDRLPEIARKAGFTLECYGQIGDFDLPVLQRPGDADGPFAYISAGVHGDEPAPPLAILEWLKHGPIPEEIPLLIYPLVNPLGLAAGTRENPQGIDINRDYGDTAKAEETRLHQSHFMKFAIERAICLHEDSDGTGFYIYDHQPSDGPDRAQKALEAAAEFTGIDHRTEIDEMPARNGRMFPPGDVFDLERGDLPEALFLYHRLNVPAVYTTESPSQQIVTRRIGAQLAALRQLLAQ